MNPSTPPREVRVGTVTGGFVSLGIALLFFIGATQDLSFIDLPTAITYSVLFIGVLGLIGAIIAGIVAMVRRR